MPRLQEGEVRRVSACDLVVGTREWAYAREHRDASVAEFERMRALSPAYFNGPIRILLDYSIDGDRFAAEFATSDFASFVYWRAHGCADDSVRDCFGCAIVRSAEGHILLGIQASGNLNAGRAYCPSGFIDPADVTADGRIDIDGSIAREIVEETGLDLALLERLPGYMLIVAGPSIAIGVEYRSTLAAGSLRARIMDHLAAEAVPELDDILFVRSPADIDGRPTTPHVPVLLRALLPEVDR